MAAAALCLAATGCSSAAVPDSNPRAVMRASLATAVATPEGLWVTVPTTTFWQLLFLPSKATGKGKGWHLATPPGVADNGGLVISPSGSSGMLAAFLPSGTLHFTPLAIETSPTAGWQADGIIESAVPSVPSAIAAGPGSNYAALVGNGTGLRTVVGPKATTTPLASLARGAPAAGVTALTAVAWSSALSMVLWAGASSKSGVLPVFGGPPNAMAPLGRPPLLLAGDRMSVVALHAGASGVSALLQLSGGHGRAIAAAFLPAGSDSWTVSSDFAIDQDVEAGRPVVEPVGTSGWLFWAQRTGAPVEVLGSTRAPWQQLASPPAHTTSLAAAGPAAVWALTSRYGVGLVEAYRYTGSTWTLEQTIAVPLPVAPGSGS